MNDNYLEVLQQYDGETIEVRRGRGAWICERSDGRKLLREYRGSVRRLEFEETVLAKLQTQGIRLVDQYVRNQEGNLITCAGDGAHYILKDWFTDRECLLADSREILTAVGWIARLHLALRSVGWQEEWDLGSILPPGPAKEMERHNREMKRVRTYVSHKRKKNAFELCVMQHFSPWYEQAVAAQEGLAFLENGQRGNRLFLCHGDLNQHHLLMRGNEAIFIEFNQMHRGCQIRDLYHFMRKVMEKHDWNEWLGRAMMEAYDRILPLSREDHDSLYYLFLYPEKYWKQLNYYYNTNKAWAPARSVEKLYRLEQQQENRNRFLASIREN
ncbi:MAG: phosphotransferase [Clostridiales bacterium]|nr:phosphotransferase [Clostridiales bacterium]